MNTALKTLLAGLATTAFVAVLACESAPEGPTAPDTTPATLSVNGVELVTVAPSKALAFAGGNGATAQRVDARSGATITNDDASLLVQPGSMSTDATIVMKAENDGFVTFKFGPSGLSFSPAAVLTISTDKANLSGIDTSTLAIAGASDDADDWQVIGGTYDPVTNTVTAPIEHFSRYALCTR